MRDWPQPVQVAVAVLAAIAAVLVVNVLLNGGHLEDPVSSVVIALVTAGAVVWASRRRGGRRS